MNSQTLGELSLSPLPGSAFVVHVPAEAREQFAARFAVYASTGHQAQILEYRGGQRTQLGHLVAPVLWAAPHLTGHLILMWRPVTSRQSIICQASSEGLDVAPSAIARRSTAVTRGLASARWPAARSSSPDAARGNLWRDDAHTCRVAVDPASRRPPRPSQLLPLNPSVLRPHNPLCSDLTEIVMPDIDANGLHPREQRARWSRWCVREMARDIGLPCRKKAAVQGIGETSREGARMKMVTVYVLAFTAAGCGPVPPKLPGQEMVPLSLVPHGFEQKDCWYKTGPNEGNSSSQEFGTTGGTGVSGAAEHRGPPVQIKCQHRLDGVVHTDAVIESPTGSVSPPKTHCGGPNGLIRRCDDDEEG